MKALPSELEAKIDEIRAWMIFSGDQDEVARRAGVWKSRVSEMLNKKIPPQKKVLAAAIEVMEENKASCGVSPKMKIA